MAWNGSGTFQRLYNWVTERDAGVPIDATKMDAEQDGIAAGITNCMAKDGQNSATANLNMGGNKLTNMAAATVASDAARYHRCFAGPRAHSIPRAWPRAPADRTPCLVQRRGAW